MGCPWASRTSPTDRAAISPNNLDGLFHLFNDLQMRSLRPARFADYALTVEPGQCQGIGNTPQRDG